MLLLRNLLPWRSRPFTSALRKERDRERVLEITKQYFPLHKTSKEQVLELCDREKITPKIQQQGKYEIPAQNHLYAKEQYDALILLFITTSTFPFRLEGRTLQWQITLQHQIHLYFLNNTLLDIYIGQFGLEL